MAPSFLTGGNNACVKCFEIRVDEDHLILRGNADEASSVLLKGNLVICNSEPLKVQGIHLSFKGQARSSFAIHAATSTKLPKQETTFLTKRWDFDNQNDNKKQNNILAAGNHEWPFEFIVRGDLPESIEGLPLSWIIYRLKATMDRGVFAKNIEARKHIRIIRTFDISSLELSHAMSVENIWPNKIQYNVSTPTKGVVFGTKVRIDFELIPLLKGLQLGKIKTDILELSEITVNTREINRTKKDERIISTDEYTIPEYVETEDIEGQDGYRFSRYVQLPRKLQQCVQSVEEKNITIKHQMKFTVGLINPDGHLSELRAVLPLHVFISPNLRLTEQNEIAGAAPSTQDMLEDLSSLAPPGYGDHQLDPLYDGLDPRGFMTPGAATPFDMSRRGSVEDLSEDARANDELSANTLHNRLMNLSTTDPISGRRAAVSGNSTPGGLTMDGSSRNSSFNGDYFSAAPGLGSRGSGSNPMSRSSSVDHTTPPGSGRNTPGTRSGGQTPMHLEFNDNDLARVPSYNTAVHSNPRTPFSNDLPDYFSATSRPPSPPETASGSASGANSPPNGAVTPIRSRHAHFTEAPPETRTIERRGQSHHKGFHIPSIRGRH